MRKRRNSGALGAVLVAGAVAVTGCGDAVPGNAVVKVDDTTITRDTFNRWMSVAASQGQPARPGQKVQVPQPPDFRACVAQKMKTAPKPAKGRPKPSEAQFKRQCQQEYEGLRDTVLSFLIAAEWVEGEASEQGIKLSERDVEKAFNQRKKAQFPKEADFQRFLKQTGFREEDIKFQVRVEELQRKLVDKITKGKDKVSEQQIGRYYERNKQQFAQPERRDLRVVLTRSRERAQQAKEALESDRSWKSVAKEYSIDQASKAQGGQLLAVAKGQQEKALDQAVFRATKDKLIGPVKTQFGWYVFEVTKVTPRSQQSLEKARPTIKAFLQRQNQQKAIDRFVKDYREKWKDKTNCRSGFVTQDCKNAPKQSKTSTAAQPQPQEPER